MFRPFKSASGKHSRSYVGLLMT